MQVKAKKHLGQHFLIDEEIAAKIVDSFTSVNTCKQVLEVGPGMGVLTKYLLKQNDLETYVIDIDRESVAYLEKNFPNLNKRIISADFLKLSFKSYFSEPFAVIGNFPYNISSQIVFKILEHKDEIPLMVGMFQKEVAERIASGPGSKVYGILSVFTQAFYTVEYLFTVNPDVFNPAPKVKSGVLRMTRNKVDTLNCDEKLFYRFVKAAFNQRRKTVRNATRSMPLKPEFADHEYLNKRAEQLSVQQFVELTNMLDKV